MGRCFVSIPQRLFRLNCLQRWRRSRGRVVRSAGASCRFDQVAATYQLSRWHRDAGPPSAAPDTPLEVEHLGLRAEPEPPQELRRAQRHVVAGGTIDLDEIAMPEILIRAR